MSKLTFKNNCPCIHTFYVPNGEGSKFTSVRINPGTHIAAMTTDQYEVLTRHPKSSLNNLLRQGKLVVLNQDVLSEVVTNDKSVNSIPYLEEFGKKVPVTEGALEKKTGTKQVTEDETKSTKTSTRRRTTKKEPITE